MDSFQRVPDVFFINHKTKEEELTLEDLIINSTGSTNMEDFLDDSDSSIEISSIVGSLSISIKEDEETEEIKNILIKKAPTPVRKSTFIPIVATRAYSTRTVSLSGKVLKNNSCLMNSSSKNVSNNYPERVSNPLARSCNL